MWYSGQGGMRMSRAVAVCLFFFFQAEDGIRDYKVTGVQTCALPISRKAAVPRWDRARWLAPYLAVTVLWLPAHGLAAGRAGLPPWVDAALLARRQIGRASCRERV